MVAEVSVEPGMRREKLRIVDQARVARQLLGDFGMLVEVAVVEAADRAGERGSAYRADERECGQGCYRFLHDRSLLLAIGRPAQSRFSVLPDSTRTARRPFTCKRNRSRFRQTRRKTVGFGPGADFQATGASRDRLRWSLPMRNCAGESRRAMRTLSSSWWSAIRRARTGSPRRSSATRPTRATSRRTRSSDCTKRPAASMDARASRPGSTGSWLIS